MTKKRTSAKPKAKQSKKVTQPTVVEAPEADIVSEVSADATSSTTVLTTAERRAQRMKGLTRHEIRTMELEVEYAYVVKDLRRVFILAGIMFAGLVAVNLAFTYLGG